MMKVTRVKEILNKIGKVKIAVYGDFCLDAYWILSPGGGEISVETSLQTQAVKDHYYSLGGASNIVANLAALKPAVIKAIGAIGDDIFGKELISQLKSLKVDTTSLIVQKENFDTVTFAKRYLGDREQTRIDFGFFNKRSMVTDNLLLESLENALQSCDAVVFNQQVPGSINNEEFIHRANELFNKYNDKVVLFDSRHYGHRFKNVCRKTNDIEAARLSGIHAESTDIISIMDVKKYAEALYNDSGKPVFITRGPRGILVAGEEGISEAPGIQLFNKIDSVGAGDTVLSALGLCLGTGLKPYEAADFANLAAAVTVQKLFRTGTASGDEIMEISRDANYIYKPELAEDQRHARYHSGSEFELCYDENDIILGNIKHAVFDHDGTISTLRQGWESIMEPVMIKAVLGEKYEIADEMLYHKVRTRIVEYIDNSTGVQTIIQMEALVEMVKEFGIVPENKILDKHGYKKIYNDALMQMVKQRIAKFKKGQLDANDFTIKGALTFLNALKKRGIQLYLASGTDSEDVKKEAEVLGYSTLFDGNIFGALGDISKYSKKMVIEKIMSDNNLHGSELAVFGDGPVEMRECRKRGGIAIGVASDEIRRYGINLEKRTRLIKAGAHIVVPDFSQSEKLLNLLVPVLSTSSV
jgi:rfaE bifunctional protein kinase chain/domain